MKLFETNEMSKVFRIPPTEKTALHLVALDKELTFTARGIFLYLRFSPEPVTLAALMNQCIVSGLSQGGIEAILHELLDGDFVQLVDSVALTPKEIIQHCRNKGISVSEFLGVPKLPKNEAINAYINGEITEGRLMYCLGCDRLEARRIVQDFKAFKGESVGGEG